MDFKELLLEAERKQKEATKKSQKMKTIDTNFTPPAAREQKTSQPRSEVVQKLIDEKKKEDRQKREAEEREWRKKEEARQEKEREEKRKATFRIPKKRACEDPPSDAESFSSISSGEEAKLSCPSSATGVHRLSSGPPDSQETHKSSSHTHSEKTERHSHRSSSKHSSGHSSKPRSGGNCREGDQHHSKTDRTKHRSDKSRYTSASSKTHKSSDREKSQGSSSSHSKTPGQSTQKHNHTEKKSHIVIKDKAMAMGENDSSGYVTSPDIGSEEEEERPATKSKPPSATKSKPPSATKHAAAKHTKQRTSSTNSKQRRDSSDTRQESGDVPVTLTRHHLKPTKDRLGGSMEERAKILQKLQAIRERMAENETGPGRKRAAYGEVKKRRAKREKLEGDFTGSCMEKITYEEEEKPSLKRPEAKPEEQKEQTVREKHSVEKLKQKKSVSEKHKKPMASKGTGRVNRFDEMHEKPPKPQTKPRPRPRPPPVNFADLMKLAEQKQTEPVKVDIVPKKEKERRPLTQEEIDRKVAREERLKTKEYKDWYRYGISANTKQDRTEKTDPQSGGFLQSNHSVVPAENNAGHSKPFSIPRRSDHPGSIKTDKHSSTSAVSRPPNPPSVSRSVPVPKSKPHPTRPGMIANKPQAMAQHLNSERRSEATRAGGEEKKQQPPSSSSRESSSQPGPQTSGSDRREGNAWDTLFTRPQYRKMKEAPAPKRKMVIDSEEEDEYDEEMDDFIDDEGEEDMGSVSSMIQKMFGYNKKKYRYDDEDDANMEVGFSEVMKEEARSARLGLQEDLEDIRREQEELRLKAMKKKMKK